MSVPLCPVHRVLERQRRALARARGRGVRRVADQADAARMPARHRKNVVQCERSDDRRRALDDVVDPRGIVRVELQDVRSPRRWFAQGRLGPPLAAVVKPPHLTGRCLERPEKRPPAEHHHVDPGGQRDIRGGGDSPEVEQARVRRCGRIR